MRGLQAPQRGPGPGLRQEQADGRVLVFPMDETGLQRMIYLAHRQNLTPTAAEKQFLTFVQGHYHI